MDEIKYLKQTKVEITAIKIDSDVYINKDSLIALLKDYKKQFSLQGVSHQREQLINLLTSLEKEGGNKFVDKEWIVDNYLKIN